MNRSLECSLLLLLFSAPLLAGEAISKAELSPPSKVESSSVTLQARFPIHDGTRCEGPVWYLENITSPDRSPIKVQFDPLSCTGEDTPSFGVQVVVDGLEPSSLYISRPAAINEEGFTTNQRQRFVLVNQVSFRTSD